MLFLQMSAKDVGVALEMAGLASLEITCINGPTAMVVAGSEKDLKSFKEQ
jgi:malonyl CoA-acyl carrier protein transacylase